MPGAVTAGVKIGIAVIGTAASIAIQMKGQADAAKAAKATAEYNAALNRMDIEQNNRNRTIEKAQNKKRFYLIQERSANLNMPLDFRFADLESFEYQALVKDYQTAQRNTTLEARARGGIYQGNVQAAAYKNQMASTALGGVSDIAMMGVGSDGKLNSFGEAMPWAG